MTEQDDPSQGRERKLAELAALGLPYLPNRYGPTRTAESIKNQYDSLEGSQVHVAGRLMRIRLMGKAAFAHIQDVSGQIQLYFKRDILGERQWEYFKLLDAGDIIGAEGRVFKTRTGEISVEVHQVVLLTKSFRPLPDKFHGLHDVETRYRQRYVDLIANEESRRIFLIRSRVVRSIRRFLDDRGFIEVETPVLQPLYGGAAATPFMTHYNLLDMKVFLRIATELYLKRLIVGGLDRVYEIGKDFRNEGISRKHNPEFTMVELYEAYADYSDIMALTEEMVAAAARDALGTTRINFGDHDLELTPPWRRISIRDALLQHADIDLNDVSTREALLEIARVRGLSVPPDMSRGRLIEELVSNLVEPHLIQPAFLIDFPVDYPGSLLAKRSASNTEIVERFEVFMGGMELGNAFTELNEPGDQRARMEEAARLSGEEYANVDEDYIEALEYGMAPTGGLGLGIDRLVMVLTNSHHLRETILFPLLRQREETHAES